jgi:hypothetical protein
MVGGLTLESLDLVIPPFERYVIFGRCKRCGRRGICREGSGNQQDIMLCMHNCKSTVQLFKQMQDE